MTDSVSTDSSASALDSYFKLTERGTSVGQEIRAGVATFLVMSYILFVNADILGAAGLDPAAVAAATALIAGLMTIAMGVFSNYPLAMAAGLGINAAVAFGLVLGSGLTPAGAMGVIVWEGILVTVLVLAGLREKVMDAIPNSLKYSIGVGIGLFILFIGFVNAGLIRQGGGTPVEFVFPNSAGPTVALVGLLITIILYVRKVKGALIIAILATTVIALIFQPSVSWPDSLSAANISFDTLGEFDLGNVWSELGVLVAILTIFTFMLTDFFDTMGTATAVIEQADLMDEDGKIEDVGKLLLVDSVGAAVGGLAGVSSNTTYIESSAGVAEGGRTGLTAVTTGVLFLIAIVLSPLALVVPGTATAPALILIGFLMVGLLKEIDFSDFEEGFPALLGIILMPLTYSITVGIAAAFVMYAVIKAVRGKAAEVSALMWVVAGACVVFFAQTLLQDWFT
jgi:AGZA family xanthine/uracil permease-like MFS transporter